VKTRSLILSALSVLALQATSPGVVFGDESGGRWNPPRQEGEDRWVPSFGITMGVTIQTQSGFADSVVFVDDMPPAEPLAGTYYGDDLGVSPYVGFEFQITSPAIEVTTRPRIFMGAEILPTFAVDRDLAFQGSPSCVSGPEPNAPCASEEDGSRRYPFGESAANGEGTVTSASVGTLAYGLSMGAAFPFEMYDRPLRFKPLVAFLSYRVDAAGVIVKADCDPVTACTDYTPNPPAPPTPGFLREYDLSDHRSRRYYSLGPGFDLEMDAGRFGPVGAVLLTGMRAYKVFGERTIGMSASDAYDDQIGVATADAAFSVTVDRWIYRAQVGIRFQWLGDQKK